MIRLGILGLGSIGQVHARALHALRDEQGVELVAYTSRSPVDSASLGWPDARACDEEGLLQEPLDLVAVCGPSELHAQHATRVLAAGRGVVVEKPLAVELAEAEDLVRTWRQSGLFGAVVAQRRLEPLCAAIKQLLDAGLLGEPRLATVTVHWWRGDDYFEAAPWRGRAPGGGSLMNQGLHSVDLLCWYLGVPEDVVGFTSTVGRTMDAENLSVAALRFPSGALGTLSSSTALPPGIPATLEIYTSQGHFRMVGADLDEWVFPDVPRPVVADAAPPGGFSDPAAIGIQGHVNQWRDILHAFVSGEAPSTPLDEGLAPLRLIDRLYHPER